MQVIGKSLILWFCLVQLDRISLRLRRFLLEGPPGAENAPSSRSGFRHGRYRCLDLRFDQIAYGAELFR